MIPESELQRIKTDSEKLYPETDYDTEVDEVATTHCRIGYIAGASAEYERAQAIKDEDYENDYIIGFFLGLIKSDQYEFAMFQIDDSHKLECILSKESMDKLRSAKRWSIVKLKGMSFDCKYLEIDYKEGDTSLLVDIMS